MNFLKNKYAIVSVSVIVILILGFSIFGGSEELGYESTIVKKADVVQEVSVTGNVKPIESVDLAFEASGKVAVINVKVGDIVEAGAYLLGLDKTDLAAKLAQAEAGVESQKAQLEQFESALSVQGSILAELERGTRVEEIKLAETKVQNAEKSLADANTNLTNVKQKADIDLANLYSDVSDILNDAYAKSDDAANRQIEDLFSELTTNDFKLTFNTTDLSLKTQVEAERLSVESEIDALKSEIDSLDVSSDLDDALQKAQAHLFIIRDFLSDLDDAVDASIGLTSTTITTYKGYVNTGRTNVNTAVSSVNSQVQLILSQKITNQNSIFTAESKVNDLTSVLLSAQDELSLKKAGATTEQIEAQEHKVVQAEANVGQQRALVKQSEASVRSFGAQLQKATLYAPIGGVVTKQDAKIGEIAPLNVPIISIISESAFEIEANIPEADIAKVKIDDIARVTLDAYGNNVLFGAKVARIDPAETVIGGVSTYKTILTFEDGNGRIKSGMTANVDILTGKAENVIAVPQRSVILKDGDKIIRLVENKNIVQKNVQTGLRGSDGQIEIIEGINEGDEVIIFIE